MNSNRIINYIMLLVITSVLHAVAGGHEAGEKRIIVSLTSYPKRYGILLYTLKSLQKQQLRPDMIILNLSESEISALGPDEIVTVLRNNGFDLLVLDEEVKRGCIKDNLACIDSLQNKIIINWFARKLGPYGKLVPTLKLFPDDIIITVDDDQEFHDDFVLGLVQEHMKFPDCIVTRVGEGITDKYYFQDGAIPTHQPVMNLVVWGAGGVLYPPHSLNRLIFDEQLFMRDYPTMDDLFYTLCAVLNHTRRVKMYSWSQWAEIQNESDLKYDIKNLPKLRDEHYYNGDYSKPTEKNRGSIIKAAPLLKEYGFEFIKSRGHKHDKKK